MKRLVLAVLMLMIPFIGFAMMPETLMMDERGNSIVWFPDETQCKDDVCMVVFGKSVSGVKSAAVVAIFCKINKCGLVSVFSYNSSGKAEEQSFVVDGKVRLDDIVPGSPMEYVKGKVCK